LDRKIVQDEEASKKADADRVAAETAAALTAKEREAVETFPQKRLEILAAYKRASDETNVGEWFAAQADLAKVESGLSSFRGTSVASTKEWMDLNAKTDALQERLQVQLGRIEDQEQRRRAAEGPKAETETPTPGPSLDDQRGPKPQNSAWDGSIRCVESYLKERLNDPDSYQHVSTTQAIASGPYWVVGSTYRAKNGFGALTLHHAQFKIQQDQVVAMDE
jgi:hypothetical protein